MSDLNEKNTENNAGSGAEKVEKKKEEKKDRKNRKSLREMLGTTRMRYGSYSATVTVVVLAIVCQQISELFVTIKALFDL